MQPQQPPAPRRRRKHLRSDEILEAAAQLVAEHGSGAMKMAAIAERAGVAKGTIYLYFVSKEALLEALAARLSLRTQTVTETHPDEQRNKPLQTRNSVANTYNRC